MKKKQKFDLREYKRMILMKKYIDYNPINSKEKEEIDEEILETLNLKAEVHRYEDLESSIKKRQKYMESMEPRIKMLEKKHKVIRGLNITEITFISISKSIVFILIILGFVKVANAQTVQGFNKFTCREAVDLGLCELKSIGFRWSYAFVGYLEDTFQNCWIGGDTTENLSKECDKDPFCIYQRLDERCEDYCFMGYDTITYRKYNVSKSLINVYTGFDCGILPKSHDLSCPYGFIFIKEKAYCLNNDGHISKNWIILNEEDDMRAMKEFESDAPAFCSSYSKMVYKGTVQHFNPNECYVYNTSSEVGNVVENCPPLYVTPINDTHAVAACTDPCYDKIQTTTENGLTVYKNYFPCNAIISLMNKNFVGCRFKLNAGGFYDKDACGTYEPGVIEKLPEEKPKERMSGYKKLPRFIWLFVLTISEFGFIILHYKLV